MPKDSTIRDDGRLPECGDSKKQENIDAPKRGLVSKVYHQEATEPPQIAAYVYTTLDAARQIRLIHVRRDSSGAIHCDLRTFSIDDLPEFSALSYRWGPPSSSYSVLVSGKRLHIRENLFQFLEEFCHVEHEYIWIDQISINQQDIQERNRQVPLMGRIYRQTTCCVVWLGNDERYLQAAREINARAEIDHKTRIEALCLLLQDSYFTRVWIVQELLLPKEIAFLFRWDTWVPWSTMKDPADFKEVFNEFLDETGKPLNPVNQGINLLYARDPGMDSRRFILNLVAYSWCACENPLDKVYGLLGLPEEPVPITVDYSRSVCTVFEDVLKIAVRHYMPGSEQHQAVFARLMCNLAHNLGFGKLDIEEPLRRIYSDVLRLIGHENLDGVEWDMDLELMWPENTYRFVAPRNPTFPQDRLWLRIKGDEERFYFINQRGSTSSGVQDAPVS